MFSTRIIFHILEVFLVLQSYPQTLTPQANIYRAVWKEHSLPIEWIIYCIIISCHKVNPYRNNNNFTNHMSQKEEKRAAARQSWFIPRIKFQCWQSNITASLNIHYRKNHTYRSCMHATTSLRQVKVCVKEVSSSIYNFSHFRRFGKTKAKMFLLYIYFPFSSFLGNKELTLV